jgi:hypothetical protein
MKLLQNSERIKSSFTPEFLNRIKNSLNKSIYNKNSQLKEESSFVKSINLPLPDTLGRVRPFSIVEGNICIVGYNEIPISDLALNIQRSLANRGILGKIISLSQFLNIPPQERDENHFVYIVHLDSSSVNLVLFKAVTHWFKSFFVFALEGLKLICGLNAQIQSSIRANEIITAIGKNISLREYLISSLTKNQFLAISETTESIRSLTKNEIGI